MVVIYEEKHIVDVAENNGFEHVFEINADPTIYKQRLTLIIKREVFYNGKNKC